MTNNDMQIMAGIVLFNPNIARLKDNVDAIIDQVNEILFVDNASENIDEIKMTFKQYNKISYIFNDINEGIAKALNLILNYAFNHEYEWIITLDQDSVVEKGLIQTYKKYSDKQEVAMLSCLIQDRNTPKNDFNVRNDIQLIDKCITSGCFTNVKSALEVGGFDENMFIDYVDFDMCIRLIEKGYKIYQVNIVGLLHETGKAERVTIFGINLVYKGHSIEIYNENPVRNYYFFRNTVYFIRKHKKQAKPYTSIIHIMWRALLVILYENPKMEKVTMIFKGICDGMKMKIV